MTCTNPDFYARFCIALGLESLLTDPRFEHAQWAIPRKHQPVLTEAFGAAIAVMTTDGCMDLFTSFDVPAQPVQTLSEYLNTDFVTDNNFIVRAASGQPSCSQPRSTDRPSGRPPLRRAGLVVFAPRLRCCQFGGPRLWRVSDQPLLPGPYIGEHSTEVLLTL